MGEFNSDDHYIYYCRQESLRRNGVAIMVTKRVQTAVLGCSLKYDRMISVRFQCKSFNIMVIQVYAPTSNAEEAEIEQFCEDLQDLLELTPPPRKKRCPFQSWYILCFQKCISSFQVIQSVGMLFIIVSYESIFLQSVAMSPLSFLILLT